MKKTVFLLSILFFPGIVFSQTVFPSADADADSSPANIEGELVEAMSSILTVMEKKGAKKVKVKLTENTKYFTAFGGFVRPDELRSGQTVWIWYEDCASTKGDVLKKAKIVKVFSLDPNDKP